MQLLERDEVLRHLDELLVAARGGAGRVCARSRAHGQGLRPTIIVIEDIHWADDATLERA